jgi:uncharacterized damage-inducible protein DinB
VLSEFFSAGFFQIIADIVIAFIAFKAILKKICAMNKPEVWLRGPIENIPALLQPVAHAILQAREEVNALMKTFPQEKLWEKPFGVASVGFHLLHLHGVLDRLFTYAKGDQLSEQQLESLKQETQPNDTTVEELVKNFDEQVDKAIKQLSEKPENTLLDKRGVGRAQLPSNVLGLLFHAAEHTMRHTGQLLVTARILMNQDEEKVFEVL